MDTLTYYFRIVVAILIFVILMFAIDTFGSCDCKERGYIPLSADDVKVLTEGSYIHGVYFGKINAQNEFMFDRDSFWTNHYTQFIKPIIDIIE